MLYVVATPIGNLGDIALRALDVLKSADLIAAEDTRHSGNLTERCSVRGLLPGKSGQRERDLRSAADCDETIIFFESPYRLTKTLAACIDVMPDRHLCIARELTKKFEEFRRGIASELLAYYQAHRPKGEIVLVISGS